MNAQFEDDVVFEVEQPRTMAVRDTSPAGLLALAVESNADVDKLEKLMDLHERWTKAEARKAFNAARSRFLSICPEITKDCTADTGRFKYKYASLQAIVKQIRQPLSECGLAFRFEFSEGEHGMITVRCILCHSDGHCESNEMSALPDDSGAKNSIQQRGSTVTYLQRYTLIGVLGITTANEDDDGRSDGQTNVEDLREHNEVARAWIDSIAAIKTCIATGQLEQAAEAWAEIPEQDQRTLWLATSKGGMFTTDERKTMKSSEWAEVNRARIKEQNK